MTRYFNLLQHNKLLLLYSNYFLDSKLNEEYFGFTKIFFFEGGRNNCPINTHKLFLNSFLLRTKKLPKNS